MKEVALADRPVGDHPAGLVAALTEEGEVDVGGQVDAAGVLQGIVKLEGGAVKGFISNFRTVKTNSLK